jgi:hypothetical protein
VVLIVEDAAQSSPSAYVEVATAGLVSGWLWQ